MKILLLVILLNFGCKKERSCESCLKSYTDTIPIDAVKPDTVISNMVAYYNIHIPNNKNIKVIYPEYTSKHHPDTYWIIDSLAVVLNPTGSSTYKDSIDLRKCLPSNQVYNKGDSFLFRMEVRNRSGDVYWTDSTYLIY